MFKIILIFTSLFFTFSAAAQSKKPQSLEQINDLLKAKKESLEPFKDKDVKVDLESLGLDDLDKTKSANSETPAPQAKEIEQKLPEEKVAEPEEKKQNTEVVKDVKDQAKNLLKKVSDLVGKKEEKPSENESKKNDKLEENKNQNTEKKVVPAVQNKVKNQQINKTNRYINSAKKRNLKKRIEAEKKRKIYEKKAADKSRKLQELRKKYLAEFQEKNPSESENSEDFADDDEKIIPQKKNLNRFISEEPPALPILDHFRTQDNLHIPIILSYEERRDIAFDAIASGNIAFFNSAYKDVENPDATNRSGDTLLTYAILMQKYPVMAALLTKGADPNLPNALGYSPIDIAIELLDIKALEILVKNKVDVNLIDSFGRTSLMHAARLGFLPAVELLVERGADINAIDNDGFTALSIAYRHKKEVVVQFLLKKGAATWIEQKYEPEKQSLIKELENRWK